MRWRLILVLSVGLNLAAAAFWLAPRHRFANSPDQTHFAPQNARAPRTRPVVVVRKEFFAWSELESTDYPTYIKNLRDIGCPEQTVRDLIIAEVNVLYTQRRLNEVPTPEQQWWRSEPDPTLAQSGAAKVQALEQDRRALLTTLLGTNWESGDPGAIRSFVPLDGPVLGDLPAETKQNVRDLAARAKKAIQAYLEAQQAAGLAPDPAQIARLRKQGRDDLAQILNPAQLEEYLLRYSESATALRGQLRGFTVTPDQFRSLFHAYDPLQQQIELSYSGSDAASVSGRNALQQQFATAMKGILGSDQFKAYLALQDPDYASALALARDAGAPAGAVQNLYQLKKAANEQMDRIRNDPTLSVLQKEQQLKAVADNEQASINGILGVSTADASAPPPIPTEPTPTPPAQVHPYNPGETLDQIASQYGVTIRAIQDANPGMTFNGIQRGTPINIPPHQ